MRNRWRGGAVMAIIFLAAACGGARAAGSVAPPVAPESAAAQAQRPLLDSSLIAALPPAERDAWFGYITTSRERHESELAAMRAELARSGAERMTRAPHGRRSLEFTSRVAADWFRSDPGRAMLASVLSYQTPSGGWSKNIDYAAGARRPGQNYSDSDGWSYVGTLDNDATTGEMRFLAAADAAEPDERYRAAFLRGVGYLLDAQYPNGCFPQVYPLQGGYHDAATFNDDATISALRILRDISRDRYAFVPADVRPRVAEGLRRGVECIVRSQVVVDGRPTVWAQQHHPLTLEPVPARSYELAGLSGRESAEVTEFLMSLSRPERRVIDAVHAAVDWFRANRIHGYVYDFETGLAERPGAGPIWARLYEIGTNRPIFSNRDGVRLYDWNQLTDRRQGYGWYSEEPAAVLQKYEDGWAARYPRLVAPGAMHVPRQGKPFDPPALRPWRQKA